MTANNKESYLGYLNKLLDEYSHTYHNPVGKKAINADYSALAEAVETNPQASKFKFMYKNIFSKSHSHKSHSKNMTIILREILLISLICH